MPAPSVIVFDVNETLTDLGRPAGLATTWFARVLRDKFALAAAGSLATFSTIADRVLHSTFAHHAPNRNPDTAVARVLEGFTSLDVHPDVPAGVRALTGGGMRLLTLSNGAAPVADRLLTNAGIRDDLGRALSVEDAGR